MGIRLHGSQPYGQSLSEISEEKRGKVAIKKKVFCHVADALTAAPYVQCIRCVGETNVFYSFVRCLAICDTVQVYNDTTSSSGLLLFKTSCQQRIEYSLHPGYGRSIDKQAATR